GEAVDGRVEDGGEGLGLVDADLAVPGLDPLHRLRMVGPAALGHEPGYLGLGLALTLAGLADVGREPLFSQAGGKRRWPRLRIFAGRLRVSHGDTLTNSLSLHSPVLVWHGWHQTDADNRIGLL